MNVRNLPGDLGPQSCGRICRVRSVPYKLRHFEQAGAPGLQTGSHGIALRIQPACRPRNVRKSVDRECQLEDSDRRRTLTALSGQVLYLSRRLNELEDFGGLLQIHLVNPHKHVAVQLFQAGRKPVQSNFQILNAIAFAQPFQQWSDHQLDPQKNALRLFGCLVHEIFSLYRLVDRELLHPHVVR